MREVRSSFQFQLPHQLVGKALVFDRDVFPEGDIPCEICAHALDSTGSEVVVGKSSVLIGLAID